MSFIQAAVINDSNLLIPPSLEEKDINDLNVTDASQESQKNKYDIYKETNKKLYDLLIEYNYLRYLNANIVISIFSLLYFNYELVNLENIN